MKYTKREFLKTSTENIATGLAALVAGVYTSKELYKPKSLKEKYSVDCCGPDHCNPDHKECQPDTFCRPDCLMKP